MRILYVTHNSPWLPKFGGAMRNYGIIRGLSNEHEVTVALASLSEEDRVFFASHAEPGIGQIRVLESSGRGTAARGFGRSTGSARTHRASFGRLVDDIQPDLVWYFERDAAKRCGFAGSVPSVLDFCDVQWQKLRRQARYQRGAENARTLGRSLVCWAEERGYAARADVSVVANSDEMRLLGPRSTVLHVPNGFDFPREMPRRQRRLKRLLFIGSLFYRPNLDGITWFCRSIWPLVRQGAPDAELSVVGHYIDNLDVVRQTEGVTVHGFVEDTGPLISSGSCLVVPLRIAGGTRLKILEAWASGLPVVSTTVGAEGLGAVHDKTALIADSEAAFAGACMRLLESPQDGARLAREAFEFGSRRYDWRTIWPDLTAALEHATKTSSQSNEPALRPQQR